MKKQILTILTVIIICILAVSCDDLPETQTGDDDSGTTASLPWDGVAADNIILITSIGVWTEGNSIDSAGETDWFKFKAEDSYYDLNWQDSVDPASTSMTCDVMVSVYNPDGTLRFGPIDNGMIDGITVDEYTDYESGEYIYIKVEGKNADSTGTYSLYFS